MVTKSEETKKPEYIRSVGRHKSSAARVRMQNGKGEFIINGKTVVEYVPTQEMQELVVSPLKTVGKEKTFDISVKVVGGGNVGQAKAVRLGVARCLVKYDEELKKVLKPEGFLKRDAKVKERKKPGLKKARRAPQWKKR